MENEKVSIFGILGGGGNRVTSDGWNINIIYPKWPNAAAVIQKPRELNKSRAIWEDVILIKLNMLEYTELDCAFSNNEQHFLIMGSGGIEVFSRHKH